MEDISVASGVEASTSQLAAQSSSKRKRPTKGTGRTNARPSWSCSECTRRKIRCDKVIPCLPCTKRNAASLCHLEDEPVLNTTPPLTDSATPTPTQGEIKVMREAISNFRSRLHHLETFVLKFSSEEDDYTKVEEGSQAMNAFEKSPHHTRSDIGASQRSIEMVRPAEKRRKVGEGDQGRESSQSSDGAKRSDTGPTPTDSDEEVEAAVLLEFVALGRDRKEDYAGRSKLVNSDAPPTILDSHSWNTLPHDPTSFQHTSYSTSPTLPRSMNSFPAAQILPLQTCSDAIVRFSLESVAWHYCCLHGSTFQAECAEFWNLGDERMLRVNPAWLALYFAVLAAGVNHMSPFDAHKAELSISDLQIKSKAYFDAAVANLYRGDFLAKHSIYSVQAIVVLVATCQALGASDLVATLLSTGIRIAQHLNIHRLGKDSEWNSKRKKEGIQPFSDKGIKTLIDREVRKRIWCILTTEDWVSVPYRRSYTIFPDHVTTDLPLNCHDEDLSAGRFQGRPLEEATVVTKSLLSLRLASCVRRLFDRVAVSGSQSYEFCLAIDQEVRKLDVPSYLDPKTDVSHLPPYVQWQRHNWRLQVEHTFLVLHRPFLGRSFKDAQFAYSRDVALQASRGILDQLYRGNGATPPLWTVAYHAIAASTVLILDLFQSSGAVSGAEMEDKRREVRVAVAELRKQAETSPIAGRGVQLLESLLEEEGKRHSDDSRAVSGSQRPVSHVRHQSRSTKESFEAVAQRASMAISDNSASAHTSPQSVAPALVAFSPEFAAMDQSFYPNDMLESLLFTGMGAPMTGTSDIDFAFDQMEHSDLWNDFGSQALDAPFM